MTQLLFQRTVLIGVISTAKINPIDNKKERKKFILLFFFQNRI